LAVASTGQAGPVVKTPGGPVFQVNGIAGEKAAFSPSTIKVKSGGTITFQDTTPGGHDAHTVTVLTSASELPKLADFLGNCAVCKLASAHLKDPRNPQKGVKAYVLRGGKPSAGPAQFTGRGDSVVIAPKGPHKSAVVTVTAPAGKTLYFFCAIHPWMQGKIVVTG
jgi:plastocyanin